MRSVVYDAGALIAVERGSRYMVGAHDMLTRRGVFPLVPANVVAQVYRDPRQVRLGRTINGCVVEPFTDELARSAGLLAKLSGASDVTDLAVVDAARRTKAHAIFTSDRGDIGSIVRALGLQVDIVEV